MEAALGALRHSSSEMTLPDGRPAWRALLDPVATEPEPHRRSMPCLQLGVAHTEPRHLTEPRTETPWKTLETVLASLREDHVTVKCATPTGTTSASSASPASPGKAYYLNRLQMAMGLDDASSSPQSSVKVVRLESFQGSELPGAVQPFSPQEKVAHWIRTASLDAERDVIEPISDSELQEASEGLDAAADMRVATEQAVLTHVLQRLESLEKALDQERDSKHDLVEKYERLLQDRSASHRRDVSALEEMVQSLQRENRKLARQVELKRKGHSVTTPLASTSLV